MKAKKLKNKMPLAKPIREVEIRYVTDKKTYSMVGTPEAVYKVIKPEALGLMQEKLWVLFLNNKNELLNFSCVSVGTVSESLVHPREVFKTAIYLNASSIIIAHNHPSGELIPSNEDLKVTDRIKEAGKIIGIKLLDHIIVSDDYYYSFQEQGKLN